MGESPKPKRIRPRAQRFGLPSAKQLRQDLRLKAIKLGVPVDLLKPLHNPPMPAPKSWDFRQTLIDSLNRQ